MSFVQLTGKSIISKRINHELALLE